MGSTFGPNGFSIRSSRHVSDSKSSDRLDVNIAACNRESGVLQVKCAGTFGPGTDGDRSGELLTRTIQRWIADHPAETLTQIEIDYTGVDYSWGDAPVSSMVGLLNHGVSRFRLVASSSNCDSLKRLLESCNLPWFELVRSDEIQGSIVLTPVPLTLRLPIALDTTMLSPRARDFAALLFNELPELKRHAQMRTGSSAQCDLLIQAESPTGDVSRGLEISMNVDDLEPRVSFGRLSVPVKPHTVIGLVDAILHDRLVLAIIVDESDEVYEGSLHLVDPTNSDALRELTGPYSSGLIQIRSWSGSADREMSRANIEGN